MLFRPVLAATALAVVSLAFPAAAGEIATMDLDFRNVNPDVESRDPDFDFSGGVWYSASDDVFGDHNLTDSNPDIGSSDPLNLFPGSERSNSFTFASQWGFEVSGSSGDDWDNILGNSAPVTFTASWDGNLIPNEGVGAPGVDIKEIFFSHIFADGSSAQASLGSWVENNNNEATPGGTLPDVWTFMSLSSLDPLTGATGAFGVVAHDPGDVMELDSFFGEYETDLAYIGVTGSGSLTAQVPEPATLGLMGVGLAGIGFAARRRRQSA